MNAPPLVSLKEHPIAAIATHLSRKEEAMDEDEDLRGRFLRRPMKLLLVAVAFVFFGVLRLRSILWLTYDLSGMYLAYLGGYLGSSLLSGVIGFTQLGAVTGLPWLGDWQNIFPSPIIAFEDFANIWLTISVIEIVIGIIGVFAVYSTLMLRRSLLAKIGSITLIIAGILDFASPYPIIESIVGVVAMFVLLRPDVKEAYALKEKKTVPAGGERVEEEVTFKAEIGTSKQRRRTGRKCPKCGLLLPPSAKICRRCGTRLLE